MILSPSPFLASFCILRCILSEMIWAFIFCAEVLKPAPFSAVWLTEGPRDLERDLELWVLPMTADLDLDLDFDLPSSPSSSRALFLPLLVTDRPLFLSIVALASTPSSPSSSLILLEVALLSVSCFLEMCAWPWPLAFFFLCSAMICDFLVLIFSKSRLSSAVKSSSLPDSIAFSSSLSICSSSLSSSASLSSMSGSTKSATLWPS
mmetsp:Transcript_8227/g.28250  ORF Transcript_8227/g.28250 Transcript_8227/m.28250 type:complete len:206 (+) Transcript_8227:88-705(+)